MPRLSSWGVLWFAVTNGMRIEIRKHKTGYQTRLRPHTRFSVAVGLSACERGSTVCESLINTAKSYRQQVLHLLGKSQSQSKSRSTVYENLDVFSMLTTLLDENNEYEFVVQVQMGKLVARLLFGDQVVQAWDVGNCLSLVNVFTAVEYEEQQITISSQ